MKKQIYENDYYWELDENNQRTKIKADVIDELRQQGITVDKNNELSFAGVSANTLENLEQTGQITSDLANAVMNLTSANSAIKNQSEGVIISEFTKAAALTNYQGQFNQNANNSTWWKSQGYAAIDMFGDMFNWTDAMKRKFKDPKHVAELE